MPWDKAYEGSMIEGARGGAEPVWSIEYLFAKLALPPPDMNDPEAAWCGIMPPSAPARHA